MKKLLLSLVLVSAALSPALANGYGYDGQGNYYQWYNTPNGGYGYDGGGNYYQWYNTGRGNGYGYDGQGNYYQWYNNGY